MYTYIYIISILLCNITSLIPARSFRLRKTWINFTYLQHSFKRLWCFTAVFWFKIISFGLKHDSKTQMVAFTQLILLNPTLEPTDAKDKKKIMSIFHIDWKSPVKMFSFIWIPNICTNVQISNYFSHQADT